MIRSPRLLSDERLANLAGTGSDPAFAMLYRRYDGPLHGYALSIVKNAEDARDTLQNAWMKALVALRAQRRNAPIRPWLFRIVHNEAIDVIRRRRGEEPLPETDRTAGSAGADVEAAGRESVAEVVADLRGLPEGQRAALVMREWADLDYGEIALALATSEGNARQLVFTARSGLVESRAGRNQSCDAIRLELAGADGRRLRNRRIRSHLATCEACSDFASENRDRRRAAAAAFLPWTPVAAPELLGGVLAGGATGGSALIGGLAKGAAVAAIVASGGVGAAELAIEKRADPAGRDRAEVVKVGGAMAEREPDAVSEAPAATARKSGSSTAGSDAAAVEAQAAVLVDEPGDSVVAVERERDGERDGDGLPRGDGDGFARDGDGDGFARDGDRGDFTRDGGGRHDRADGGRTGGSGGDGFGGSGGSGSGGDRSSAGFDGDGGRHRRASTHTDFFGAPSGAHTGD